MRTLVLSLVLLAGRGMAYTMGGTTVVEAYCCPCLSGQQSCTICHGCAFPVALRTVEDCGVGATECEMPYRIINVAHCDTGQTCKINEWGFFRDKTMNYSLLMSPWWLEAWKGKPDFKPRSNGVWMVVSSKDARVLRYGGTKNQVGYVCSQGHLWYRDVLEVKPQ